MDGDSGSRGAARVLDGPAVAPATTGAQPGAERSPGLSGEAPPVSPAPLLGEHRARVEEILRATGMFREDEIDVALEVFDSHIAAPGQDYHAVGAFTPGGQLLGYILYGATPCTLGTWDLYWIAVHPDAQGLGVGSTLTKEMERRLARTDARLVLIETSSRPHYDPTRSFYLRRGWEEVARIKDFYEPGDDRVIFAKTMNPAADASVATGAAHVASAPPTPGEVPNG